ncbi:MAG: hypothetical protein ACO1OQ_12565, partial [Rufibacter sp.]
GNVATGGGSLDLATILSNVAGGGVGGAILMAVIGLIKNQMAKNELYLIGKRFGSGRGGV